MKRYTMAKYLQELHEVSQLFEEGLITDFELFQRVNSITICYSHAQAQKLKRKLNHINQELELAEAILR